LKIKVKCLDGPIVLISSFEKSISEPLNLYNLPDLTNFLVVGSLYFIPKLKKTYLFDDASELSVYDELDAILFFKKVSRLSSVSGIQVSPEKTSTNKTVS